MVVHATFPAGLALASNKRADCVLPILELAPPQRVVLALDQGSGHLATPVVAVGAMVGRGMLVARADEPRASHVHASIAGQVVAIEPRAAAAGDDECLCIVIETGDAPRSWTPASASARSDAAQLEPDELVQGLRMAGIAGLGGAGFPTATKIAAARAQAVHTLVVNGVECEPWITCDDALMQVAADEIVQGARLLRRATDTARCVIAIEDDKPAAIAAMTGAIARAHDSTLSLAIVPAVYPQGAERQLVTAVAGLEVPSAGLPIDAGVICQNVATAFATARWAATGEPAISRVVTVTGSGVERPCNVRAPIGAPIAALIEAAGGYRDTPLRLIAGGSMMGRALSSDEVGLTKAMNCILVATRVDVSPRLEARELPCIRCGDCAAVCPAGLLPQQLHREALTDNHGALQRLGLRDCIDCGLCDFVCPSQIPLAQRFRLARRRLDSAETATRKAAAAREHHQLHEQRLRAAAAAEQRTFEDVRNRARGKDGVDAAGSD